MTQTGRARPAKDTNPERTNESSRRSAVFIVGVIAGDARALIQRTLISSWAVKDAIVVRIPSCSSGVDD